MMFSEWPQAPQLRCGQERGDYLGFEGDWTAMVPLVGPCLGVRVLDEV